MVHMYEILEYEYYTIIQLPKTGHIIIHNYVKKIR